jgi:DNA-binding MarR family transcriptional regulator
VSDTEPIQDGKSEISGFILERTAKRMKQYFQQKLAQTDADITVDQWVVLQELDREEGLSQLEIGRATFKDAPTITRIIDLLCKKGLTRRTPDPEDRRRFRIQLTGKGRQKIGEVLPTVKSFRREAWQGLKEEEVDRLVSTLNKIFENLND